MKLTPVFSLFFALIAPCSLAGEIALTFDDAPTPSSDVMDGKTRTDTLIRSLRDAEVEEVLFFVTTKHLDSTSAERLRAYTRAGHLLGNHSHEHLSANKIEADDVLADAAKAHRILEPFDNVMPFYRFPYLHQGADRESRQKIAAGLDDLGYSIGYVTVDNFDWYINSAYQDAVKNGKTIDKKKLGQLYVDTVWSTIEFYDAIAQSSLGRSPKHVLLLHENDIAAAFTGDLIRHIRSQGWTIISPREAYSDPISQHTGDLSFTKQGRVAALAHDAGVPIERLRHPSENTEYLDKLFKQSGAIQD